MQLSNAESRGPLEGSFWADAMAFKPPQLPLGSGVALLLDGGAG